MGRRFFDWSNAAGAKVYDVDSKEQLRHVQCVDIDHGEVWRAEQPLRVEGDEIVEYVTRFKTIYPIYGDAMKPQLFHCYGRIE